MPSATSIVARSSPDQIIGVENRLPWHLGTDLRHFRTRTESHAIIMGRKTYESIGRPLPKRHNIVLSHREIESSKDLHWAKNVETALLMADVYSIRNFKDQFFVIGGERIYDTFREFINRVYLTEVYCRINGDAKFSWDFPESEWRSYKKREFPKSDVDDYPFSITALFRKKPVHRHQTKDRLLRNDPEVARFLGDYEAMIAQSSAVEREEQLNLL